MPVPFRASLRQVQPPFLSTSLGGLEQVIPPERHSVEALFSDRQSHEPLPDIPGSISTADSCENSVSEIIESYMSSDVENVSLTAPSHLMVDEDHSPASPDCCALEFRPPSHCTTLRNPQSSGPPCENLQAKADTCRHCEHISTRVNLLYGRDQYISSCPELRSCCDIQPSLYDSSRMRSDLLLSPETNSVPDPSLVPSPFDPDGSQHWRPDRCGAFLDTLGGAISDLTSRESGRSRFRSWMSEDTLSTASIGQRASLLSVSVDFPLRLTLADAADAQAPEPEQRLANARQEMKIECDERTRFYSCSSPSILYGGDNGTWSGHGDNHAPSQRRKQLAIPLSDYQKYGPAAWKSPKLKPKRSIISRRIRKSREDIAQQAAPPKRPPQSLVPSSPSWNEAVEQSHRNGPRHWWRSTLKVTRIKLGMVSRTDQRKERLKNQIVMVGPADQFAGE
jgi:hypothetical protein